MPRVLVIDDDEMQRTLLDRMLSSLDLVVETGEIDDLSLMFGDLASIEEVFQRPQRHIMWGASTEDQVSWTSGLGNGTGVFTYFMGEALMSAPLNASFLDLQRDVHDNTIDYTRDNDMTDQNPTMRGDNARMTLGEFFGVR